jgi:exopolysaccharide production protein ExoZ
VVVFHAGRYIAGAVPEAAWRWGEFGVDVFFVVSGFVMMVATPPGAAWRVFVARRAIRVLPMYWLATLLMALLVWLPPPGLFVSAVLTASHLLLSLGLVPHYSPTLPGEIVPLLVPGWTLSYELYFYLVFALFLRFSPPRRVLAVVATFLLIAAMTAAFGDGALAVFARRDLLLEFVFGMLVALAWQRGWRCPAVAAWPVALAAGVLLAIFATPSTRVAVAGLAGAVMVWALASAPAARRAPGRALEALGDASYSLYLLHPFVVGTVWFAWQRLGAGNAIAFTALCLAASALAGWVAWRLVEAPVTRALRAVVPAKAGTRVRGASPP